MEEGISQAEPAPRSWLLYVLRCRDGTLYAGITTDLDRRLAVHLGGRGARYTRGRAPLEVAACWPYSDESAVRRAEARFKRLPRKRKLLALEQAQPP